MHFLLLFIKQELIYTMPINLTPYGYIDSGDILDIDNQKIFFETENLRELEVKQTAERLRLMFYKMLINANFDYCIELKCESKLNELFRVD